MSNYQILFSGQVMASMDEDSVRDNLASELGLDKQKAKQLFSGRTVVIRSQLEEHEAYAWQERMAELGAICRIKNVAPQETPLGIRDGVQKDLGSDQTLRDITAAHCECPRCGHMQLDSSHCAKCGVDLEAAFRQKRKEDIMIEKKLRELRTKQSTDAPPPKRKVAKPQPQARIYTDTAESGDKSTKKGMLHWLKRG